jgi:DNA-binding MurR/RpiR family transcriptional regulator
LNTSVDGLGEQAGRLGFQGFLQLQSEFEASLDYKTLSQKNQINKQTNKKNPKKQILKKGCSSAAGVLAYYTPVTHKSM